jgi:hypothetical protein
MQIHLTTLPYKLRIFGAPPGKLKLLCYDVVKFLIFHERLLSSRNSHLTESSSAFFSVTDTEEGTSFVVDEKTFEQFPTEGLIVNPDSWIALQLDEGTIENSKHFLSFHFFL